MRTKANLLDSAFSKFIRLRDGLCCQRCGKGYTLSDRGLHNSHFIGRGNHQTRYDPENCDALCWGCHQFFETHKATAYRDWKLEQLGEQRFDALIERSRDTKKFDKEAAKAHVAELLKSVEVAA